MAYASLAYAQAYFDKRLHVQPWENATPADKRKALDMATADINALNFIDQKADSNQADAFPRTGQTAVPEDIQKACCEIALNRLDGQDPEIELRNTTMSSQGIAGMQTSWNGAVPEHLLAGIVSFAAWRLLLPYLLERNRIHLSRIS